MHLPNLVSRTLLALCFLFSFTAIQAAEVTKEEGDEAERAHIVMPVIVDSLQAWDFTLKGVGNILDEYHKNGVTIEIEVVAYGPGLKMLLLGSAVGPRLMEAMAAGVQFKACEYTMNVLGVTKEGLYPGVGTVPSGRVEIAKKQFADWAYVM